MKRINIGIIGLGFMGTTHFRIYRSLPGARVAAVADVDPARRSGDLSGVVGNIDAAGGTPALDLSGISVYADARDLIDDPALDVVDVCCPTVYHKDYIVRALARGRHVMAEKPLARTLAEAAEIAAAYRQATSFLNFGMCVRAWPEYRHAYENFKAGRYGRMLSATFRRLSPSVSGNSWNDWYLRKEMSGGALLDMHLHDTDQVCYFFGRPVSVVSFGRTLNSDCAIDHVVTVYRFGDGSLVEAEGCWGAPAATPFEMTFQIICEKATVRLMAEGFKVYWNDGTVETPQLEKATGWDKELQYFVDCVQTGTPPDRYQTFDSVHDAFKVVMAEQESIDRGSRPIEVQY